MDTLENNFKPKFEKTGVALTACQLYSYAKDKNLKGVTLSMVYAFLNNQEDESVND